MAYVLKPSELSNVFLITERIHNDDGGMNVTIRLEPVDPEVHGPRAISYNQAFEDNEILGKGDYIWFTEGQRQVEEVIKNPDGTYSRHGNRPARVISRIEQA